MTPTSFIAWFADTKDMNMTNKQLRDRIMAWTDIESVRITRNGEVHAYGKMPNSNKTGWYLVGFSENLIDEYEYQDKYA